MNKKALLFITVLIASGVTTVLTQSFTHASPALALTVTTNKQTYYLRENVNIYGNLTSDGSPVSDGLVAIGVLDERNGRILRTLTTGYITTVESPLKILELIPCDSTYLNPIDILEIKPYPYVTWSYFKVRVKNTDTISHTAVISVCVYDGNGIWLSTKASRGPVGPGESEAYASLVIPYWAYIGEAKVVANAYTGWPEGGGVPYCLEASASFMICRGGGGGATGLTAQMYENPVRVGISEIDGAYNTTFKLSPEPANGTYHVFANARRAGSFSPKAEKETTFEVGTVPSPPQASFTYFPLQPYVNQSVKFDASASTAEGIDDNITSYEWNFGDGTYAFRETPTVSHTFTQVQTYIVTLNVTDSEGLWCTTSKPVTTQPPTGPTADFIWYPATPNPNKTVTFDATTSTPGWNGTGHPPIVSYQWDFDDGNITTVDVPTIDHVYKNEANYSVTLTVTDSGGLQSNKTQTVMVTTAPALEGDINGDGKVDIIDLVLVIGAYGSYPGHPEWNPNADINGDGKVDIVDLVKVISHYGEHI